MKIARPTSPDYTDSSVVTGPIKVLDHAHSHQHSFVADTLGVDVETGLSNAEAALRLRRDGHNEVGRETGTAWPQILLRQFASVIVWLLLAATVIAWFTNGFAEAVAIIAVLLLNAAIGFAMEWRAGQALNALRRETVAQARVRRNGRESIVNAAELVIGDIVILTAGDRVPADARLIEATNLLSDESVLTGESTAVEKSIESVSISSILAERRSMVYLGTMIVGGRALAIVTATGTYTEMGRIGQLLSKTESEKTPLELRLASMGTILVYIVLGIVTVVMIAGLLRGDEGWLMLEVAISLAVAAVPEALPAMTTLVLALGVLRMSRNRAIVRRLAAVEALGSTTVICTDKTGTLTENRITVREYQLANGRHFEAQTVPQNDPVLSRLLRVGVLCNEATLVPGDAKIETIGDPTETALLLSAHAFKCDISTERLQFETVFEEPFEAASRRMITVVHDVAQGIDLALMKGAPAIVLASCTYYISADGSELPLDEAGRQGFLANNEIMAAKALRVLAFADKHFADNDHVASEYHAGYTFLGFVGMADPPSPGVADAIRVASQAGIRIIMLTGDQLSTARAIARELSLSQSNDVFAMHSSDIVDLEGSELVDAVMRAHVFARVTPEDKLRIVEALQDAGEIVAVTGDGINDAPALKRANIGIAMGGRGTEVAKEAADVVLTDDNFSTIVKAIEGGRAIYANIIKFVNFMFAANLAEVLVIFLSILAGFTLPLLPLQILWINLVTDIFPALALAVEPPERDTMKHRPRPPDEALLSSNFLLLIAGQGLILAVITLAAYIWALSEYGEGPHARTVALLALVGVQMGHLFNCRSRTRSAFNGFLRNPYVLIAIVFVVALESLAVYFAPLSSLLDLVPPNTIDLFVVLTCTLLPLVTGEVIKAVMRRRGCIPTTVTEPPICSSKLVE